MRQPLTARLRAGIPEAWRELASPAVEYAAAPLAARRRMRRFVIVCGPRTGSELLRELLDGLAEVRCEGEVLRRWKRWPVDYLNGRAALGGLGRLAWGCKLLDAHLHQSQAESRPPGEQVLDELVAGGWKIVHLRRRDILAQALSFLHAMHGQWHFRGPSGFEPFTADPATVIALLYMLDGNARWLEERLEHVPHAAVSYEDDLSSKQDQQATLTRMTDLLGVAHHEVTTDLCAVAPTRADARITNFDEVARAVAHTRFASLVETRSQED